MLCIAVAEVAGIVKVSGLVATAVNHTADRQAEAAVGPSHQTAGLAGLEVRSPLVEAEAAVMAHQRSSGVD